MTSRPAPRHEPSAPTHLLTVAEYAALGETEPGYTELVEGRLLMSPSPAPDHNTATFELGYQLRPQLPGEYEAILDMDVDLELAPASQPGFSRRPDLIIVERAARKRVRMEGGLIRATEVLVVVEVVSPGSRRTDNVEKRGEYADAGIPWYWIVDITPPISLVACRLTEEFGYLDHQQATGTFETAEPFAVSVDLDNLGA